MTDSVAGQDVAATADGSRTLLATLQDRPISVRLQNCLCDSRAFFEGWILNAVLASPAAFRSALLGLPRLGAKTAAEVLEAVAQQIPGLPDVRPDDTAGSGATQHGRGGVPISVGDVLLAADHSVRLHNCIIRAPELFASWTVSDALQKPDLFVASLRQVPNLGGGTVIEIREALSRFEGQPWAVHAVVDGDKAPPDPTAGFDPSALAEPVSEVLADRNVSARLARIAASNEAAGLTVRDVIVDPARVERCLRAAKGSGRITAGETMAVLWARVAELGGRDPSRDEAGRDLDDEACDENEDGPAGERARRLLEELDERQVQVIDARYGLTGKRPMTLQEFASSVHRTRERIRQIEAKAIRKLGQTRRRMAVFQEIVASMQDGQWSLLATHGTFVDRRSLGQRSEALDPMFRLAVDVAVGSLAKWLSDFGASGDGGWYRSRHDIELRRAADRTARELIARYVMPMPLATANALAGAGSSLPVDGAGEGWSVFEGYLCSGFLGLTTKRLVRMHAVATSDPDLALSDMSRIIEAYRGRHPEDACAASLFMRHAQEARHLFVQVPDNLWFAISGAPTLRKLQAPPYHSGRLDPVGINEVSLESRLVRALSSEGPRRMVDLRKDLAAADDGSAISPSSVGAILSSHAPFRKIAPGLYALYGPEDLWTEKALRLILDERNCRRYCFARHGGAPMGYFPAWTASHEERLARWARANAPSDLYRSLMAVAEPELWQASPDVVEAGRGAKVRDGRWLIETKRQQPLGGRFLDPAQFLTALIHLSVYGWLSWVAVNRCAGSKMDNHDAADVLAFFVASGLCGCPEDWQAAHPATPLATGTCEILLKERHRFGALSWDRGGLKVLLDWAQAKPVDGRIGWIPADEIAPAFQGWRSGEASTGKAFRGRAAEPIDVDELADSDEWGAAFGA